MCAKRRECRFANKDFKNVDLTQYSKLITDTIEMIIPGKNPKVEKDKFSTDELTHKEAVRLGRALASLDELECYGTLLYFLLFLITLQMLTGQRRNPCIAVLSTYTRV